MKKLDKHISITKELNDRILLSCKEHGRKYSAEVSYLISKAIDSNEEKNKFNEIESELKSIVKKEYYIFELLKQIYSDMDFNNLSDPKKSFALNEFMKRMKGDRFDD